MYIPAHFHQTETPALLDAIERYSFGLLISNRQGQPFATHVPLILERDNGPHGSLVGHLARANPQWEELAGQSVLSVFSGPHAYISPSWYETENMVPTWNYVAGHAYGQASLIESRDEVKEIIERSGTVYESSRPQPWKLDATPTFLNRMLDQIVGFRIAIERIEGKWKLNQNHPVERREKVIHALRKDGDENSVGIAELMSQSLPKR
ncbi:MAG: FMN-binding negative transcriptional regulator [Gemmataceae bacterium]